MSKKVMGLVVLLVALMLMAGCPQKDEEQERLERGKGVVEMEQIFIGGWTVSSIYRFNDAGAGVTCWVYMGGGISCLRN